MAAKSMDLPAVMECPPELATQQLNRILADPLFASAERNSRFLRYVVETTLAGKASEIKEMILATELYGRSGDYDPKVDSIVRVEASRVRNRLQSYYQERGAGDPVRITLPRGTYVPQFELRETATAPAPAVVEAPRALSRAPRAMLAALALFAGVGALGHSAVVRIAGMVMPGGIAGRGVNVIPASEAMLAWQEGNELLRQDPHSGQSERGMPPTLERAIARYEYAVAKEPGFARGWASLAEAYEYSAPFVGRDWTDDAARAEAAARRAVALDPNLPAAHAMLGMVLFYLRWDFAAAEKSYRRAVDLDPRNPWPIVELADLLRQTGRPEQAAEEIRRARALMPALPVLAVKEAEIQLDLRRPDAALLTANAAIRLSHDTRKAHIALGMAWEAKGELDRALASYRNALEMNPTDRHALPAIGHLYGLMKRPQDAREILKRLKQVNERTRNVSYQLAVVHAGLGESEEALTWLERAHRTRQSYLPFMAVDYRFRALRAHPRFRAILARVGLRAAPETL